MAKCECGCGAEVTPGRRFVSGHNGRGQKRSAATRRTLASQKIGERNPQYGRRPANYRGRYVNSDGYVLIHIPTHPMSQPTKGYVMEHRLVFEAHERATNPASPHLIDGFLRSDVHIHHINGVKDDNRIENLEPMSIEEHTRHHREMLTQARWTLEHRARQAEMARAQQLAKTHCKRGHELPEPGGDGVRRCPACHAERQRLYRQRRASG